ncbi:MAG: thiamine phosphate synthase [Candidatus Acidiferrales bacterium]
MPLPFPPLYAIFDVAVVDSKAHIPEVLAENGLGLIQLRDKHASPRAVFEASKDLVARLSPRGVRVIVNDRSDIAAMAGAGGVHVGQDDLPVEAARACCGGDLWVGVSTHSLEQYRLAMSTSADYIAVGPIFPTATKANPDPVVGLDLIRAASRLTRKPLVAIGGITIQSAESVYRAGADSIAVVSDLLSAPKPGLRAAEYIGIASRVLAARD